MLDRVDEERHEDPNAKGLATDASTCAGQGELFVLIEEARPRPEPKLLWNEREMVPDPGLDRDGIYLGVANRLACDVERSSNR
jgi:hypothetical protein